MRAGGGACGHEPVRRARMRTGLRRATNSHSGRRISALKLFTSPMVKWSVSAPALGAPRCAFHRRSNERASLLVVAR